MSGGQTGGRGGCRQTCRCRVQRKRKQRRTGRNRRGRKPVAAEKIGQLVKTAIDALARRVLADAERRTDFLKVLAFQVVQNDRLPVRLAQFQQRLIEQRHKRRPHGIAIRAGQVQIDRDLFATAAAQFGAQPFAGFVQRRLVEPARDGRVRPQFAAACASATNTFCVISSAAPASPTCRKAVAKTRLTCCRTSAANASSLRRALNSAINEWSGSDMVSTGILTPRRETGNKSFEALPKFRGSRGNEARTGIQKTKIEPPHVGCHGFYFAFSTTSIFTGATPGINSNPSCWMSACLKFSCRGSFWEFHLRSTS